METHNVIANTVDQYTKAISRIPDDIENMRVGIVTTMRMGIVTTIYVKYGVSRNEP